MSNIKTLIDINCDLGEGMPNDALLMPYLGSCNIACGGHAGDKSSMIKSVGLAIEHQVKVGAHPSYPDPANFGRVVLNIDEAHLKESLFFQIESFENICHAQKTKMNHIKPHGALYNQMAKDESTAIMFLELMQKKFPEQILYCPPNSVISNLAPKYNIKIALEIFADRNYHDDLSLVPRNHPLALLTDEKDVLEHIKPMINEKSIRTISGKKIKIAADTLCVHGDNPNALNILQMINTNFLI